MLLAVLLTTPALRWLYATLVTFAMFLPLTVLSIINCSNTANYTKQGWKPASLVPMQPAMISMEHGGAGDEARSDHSMHVLYISRHLRYES